VWNEVKFLQRVRSDFKLFSGKRDIGRGAAGDVSVLLSDAKFSLAGRSGGFSNN
jgi:hypothetical protein